MQCSVEGCMGKLGPKTSYITPTRSSPAFVYGNDGGSLKFDVVCVCLCVCVPDGVAEKDRGAGRMDEEGLRVSEMPRLPSLVQEAESGDRPRTWCMEKGLPSMGFPLNSRGTGTLL